MSPRLLPALSAFLLAAGCATSPMARAIQGGRTAEVAALLDGGYDLNAKLGKAEMTPLKAAVTYRQRDVAALLLERGADPNVRHNGTGALSIAAMNGDEEMVALLLSKGAEATPRDAAWAQGSRRARIQGMLQAAAAARSLMTPAVSTAAAGASAPQDELAPAYKVGERPDDLAVLVGVEAYMDGRAVPFCERDAAAVRDHLRALGWPGRNVVVLTGKAAGRAGLARYLGGWLPNNVTQNSRVVFYFAGAGAADAKTGQAYLLPWDGDPDQLEATGYPLLRLYEKLNALKARSVLAVFDAGFTGGGARSASPKAAKADLGVAAQGDVVVLAAASDGETAGVQERARHGALTYGLLKGLNEDADARTRAVTLKDLFLHMKPKMEQTPRLFTGTLGEGDLRLR